MQEWCKKVQKVPLKVIDIHESIEYNNEIVKVSLFCGSQTIVLAGQNENSLIVLEKARVEQRVPKRESLR